MKETSRVSEKLLDLPEIICDDEEVGSDASELSDEVVQSKRPRSSTETLLERNQTLAIQGLNENELPKSPKKKNFKELNGNVEEKTTRKDKVAMRSETVDDWLRFGNNFDSTNNQQSVSMDVKNLNKTTKELKSSFNDDDTDSDLSEIPEDFFGVDEETITEPISAITPKLVLKGNGSIVTPVSQKKARFREPLTDVRLIPSNSQSDFFISPPSPPSLPLTNLDFTFTTTKKNVEREAYEKTDQFTGYLLRKPKELKLPVNPDTLRPKKLKIKKANEKYEAEISTFGPQLLHAGQVMVKNDEKGRSEKYRQIDNEISLAILLRPKLDLSAIGPIDGEIDECLPILPIRRQPVVDDETKERLVPFGLKRKKRRSLPGLSVKQPKQLCKEQ